MGGLLCKAVGGHDAANRLQLDREIHSAIVDANLHRQMSRVLSNISVDDVIVNRSISFDALKDAIGCVLEMNDKVGKNIVKHKEEVEDDPELLALVEEFFDSNAQTLEFCSVLKSCLNKAMNDQMILLVGLNLFEDRSGGEEKYRGALEKLRRFKETENPFGEEFFRAFTTIYHRQKLLVDKLKSLSEEMNLGKKLKSIKTWRKVWAKIFVAAVVSIWVCIVVAAAMAAPPLLAALVAAASSAPLGWVVKWVVSLLESRWEKLEEQDELIQAMVNETTTVRVELDSVEAEVHDLEIWIKSLLETVDFSLRGEEELKVAVDEMKKKVEVSRKSMYQLMGQAEHCVLRTRDAKKVIEEMREKPKLKRSWRISCVQS